MMAIQEAIESGRLQAQIAVVISNKPQAKGIQYAKDKGLATYVVNPNEYDSLDDYEQVVVDRLKQHHIHLVILAGYMKLVGDVMLQAYEGKMLNIHPSLLPSFKGLRAQKQALDYGVKIAGCTVHYVIKEMDAGPIIAQSAVSVLDDDTEDVLADRILKKEHELFPNAIQSVLNQLLT